MGKDCYIKHCEIEYVFIIHQKHISWGMLDRIINSRAQLVIEQVKIRELIPEGNELFFDVGILDEMMNDPEDDTNDGTKEEILNLLDVLRIKVKAKYLKINFH